jgi:hypothetical protein
MNRGISFARRRTPMPSMRFTRRRCAPAGMTTVRPLCARNTAPITTPPSSSIRTYTGLSRPRRNLKSVTIRLNPLPCAGRVWPEAPEFARLAGGVRFALDSPLEGDGFEPSVPRQR